MILAGYKNRMDTFFNSNPGMASRIAHHIDFPDYSEAELMQIAQLMLGKLNYSFDDSAISAFSDYVRLRKTRPRFSMGEDQPVFDVSERIRR